MVENCIVSDGGSKKTRSFSSRSYISGLSDELLVDILCRLGSSKYATQCRCICKRWFSLIDTSSLSDSYFLCHWLHMHGKAKKEAPMALLTQCQVEGDNFHTISYAESHRELLNFMFLKFLSGHHNLHCVLATYKDLVLCCPSESDHSVYYICNAFTGQWITLPPPPPINALCKCSKFRVGLLVAEDDDDDGHGFVFKVVRVTSTFLAEKMIVEIFSSDDSTNEWREVVVPDEWRLMDVPDAVYYLRLISYDGTMVWLSRDIKRIIVLRINPRDANADRVFWVSLPLQYQAYQGSLIGVCKGCLRIAQLVGNTNQNNFRHVLKLFIWELNSYSQNTWELVHEFHFSKIENSTCSFLDGICNEGVKVEFPSVLAFHPHDRDLLYLQFALSYRSLLLDPKVDSRILLCNIRKRTLEAIGEIPTQNSCIAFPLWQPCWPTPVPLLSNHTNG